MGHTSKTTRRNIQSWLIVLVMLVIGMGLGYQANASFKVLAQREVHAQQAPTTPVSAAAGASAGIPASAGGATAQPEPGVSAAPPTPEPAPTQAVGDGEMDAAGKVIPVPKVSLPKGPRKLPAVRLVVPRIGLDSKVIELGTRYNDKGELIWETAPFAAGHHSGTANPGEPGNVVISGHISSPKEGAVFKRLPEINVGDGLVVITADRDYLYRVVDTKVVEPDQTDIMASGAEETLTLLTCVPDGIYSHRLVVTAKRI